MSVSFRSSSTKKYASTTNTTVNKPAGVVDGDFLVALVSTGANPGFTPSTPAGWSLVKTFADISDPTLFTVRNHVYTKVAASEGASWTWNHATNTVEITVLAFTGVDTSDPFEPVIPALNVGTTGGGVVSSTALGVTTVRDDSMVIYFAQDWGDTANTLVAPTGSTPTFTEQATCPTTSLQSIATGVLATAGATGNKSQVSNTSTSGSKWGAVLIVIQPVAPAAPGADTGPGLVVGSPLSFVGEGAIGAPDNSGQQPFTQKDFSNPVRLPSPNVNWFKGPLPQTQVQEKPFTQKDFSNPVRLPPPSPNANWFTGALPEAASAAKPCSVADWGPFKPPYWDLSYTYDSNPPIISYRPCSVTIWSLPENAPYVGAVHSWTNRSSALLSVLQKPFTQVDQSNPRAVEQPRRDWINRQTSLLNTEFSLPVSVTVWPVADLTKAPISLDWVNNPLRAVAVVALPANNKQELPRTVDQPRRDWFSPSTALLASVVVVAKPFTQQDQSNPRTLARQNADWTSSSAELAQRPFTQVDRDNPRSPPLWLRDWIIRCNSLLAPIVVDKPFTQPTDWLQRAAPQSPRDWFSRSSALIPPPDNSLPSTVTNWEVSLLQTVVRDWINRSAALLSAVVVVKPFTQVDRSLPVAVAAQPRDWVSRSSALLSSVVAKPFTQQVDRTTQPVQVTQPRDWFSRASALLAAKPFTQVDQSLPTAVVTRARDWTNRSSALLSAPAIPPKPFTQVDQSNPRGVPPPVPNWQYQSIAQRISIVIPPPPPRTHSGGRPVGGGIELRDNAVTGGRRNEASSHRANEGSFGRDNTPRDRR